MMTTISSKREASARLRRARVAARLAEWKFGVIRRQLLTRHNLMLVRAYRNGKAEYFLVDTANRNGELVAVETTGGIAIAMFRAARSCRVLGSVISTTDARTQAAMDRLGKRGGLQAIVDAYRRKEDVLCN